MTRVLTSRRARWAVPALVAAAVAAAAITTTNGAGASERPNLPARTAASLLAAVQQAHPVALSGTIVETAHLGLPDLPTSGFGGSGVSLQSLLTGSHTLRVWYDGPTRQRIALLAPLSERDVIHDGTDLWTYTSTTNEVTHATVDRNAPTVNPDMLGLTPQQAARRALNAVDPTTEVTVDSTARVAGRAAYQLSLVPRDSRSLIGSVRIAIDSATSVPLRVQLFGSGSTPAIEVGFTDISFSTPNPSVFRFVPPSGATVQEEGEDSDRPSSTTPEQAPSRPAPSTGGTTAAEHRRVLGSGWTAVVDYPMDAGALWHDGLLERVSREVPTGRLVTTALVSVLVTFDGHVYVGPVSGTAIQRVAATGHGL